MTFTKNISPLRGSTVVAGIGQSAFYKRGKANQDAFKLALDAILKACQDAGMSPADIDGFASFSDEECSPTRLASALGIKELCHTSMCWGGGGGGIAAAIEHAAAAITTGQAKNIVVFRAISQPSGKRFGQGGGYKTVSDEFAHLFPYGILTPAQMFAFKIERFLKLNNISSKPMRNIALASYHHAQNNPNAIMYGKPLDVEQYENSRMIVSPLRLHDCCLETDGAAAFILTSAERADELPHPPCYLLGAATGCQGRAGAAIHNAPDFATANFKPVAKRLFEASGVSVSDVNVVQSYENFTGGVLMSLVEHGLCAIEDVEKHFEVDNLLARTGKLPLNTSGGHLAEAYLQGLNLSIEAIRQIRGTSFNQVKDANVALVSGGPLIAPVSSALFGSKAALS